MSIKKIIRNESGTTVQILNRDVANSESYDISRHLWAELADDAGIKAAIEASTLVVNNGDSDLSIEEGLEHLLRWQTQTAKNTIFDNATNGFVATEVQSAIEEGLNVATLKPRFSIVATFNGTVSNNDWLGYDNLLPGNDVPIRIPMNCILKEITFAYKDTLLGSASIDGKFRLYKNGFTNPTHVIHTEQFTNQNNGKTVDSLSLVLSKDDFIVGRWTDEGDNPSDMAIVYFFQVE